MTDPIGTAQERELIERLTYLVQFYVYAEAEQKDVQDIIEGLAERDSFTASDGWIIVKEDEYDALVGRLREALQLFVRSAVPVASEINPRGHNWCEAYLDDALKNAAALSLQRRV